MERVDFEDVGTADLVVDRVYGGGSRGNRGDDPISKILPVGNAGGFRFRGSPTHGTVRALVLYTSLTSPEWPDRLDLATGVFIYYGDNKRPGSELHDTPRKGNAALRDLFESARTAAGRASVPPIFLFSKGPAGADAVFRGLLVPGSATASADEHLVAIWRSANEERFQNYRAMFSVLDVQSVSRAWLDEIVEGRPDAGHAPKVWMDWRRTGIPTPLLAPRSIEHRTRDQQLPRAPKDMEMLAAIHRHFGDRPHHFEHCAARIWWMLAPATDEIEVTRQSRDGGRDAIGRYNLGPSSDQIKIDFALEAKCYAPTTAVGVREMSRLISRLRHRDFGVMVTTSFVHEQAYREVRDDRHPVAIVCGRDIVDVLKTQGLTTPAALSEWLEAEFPADPPSVRAEVGFERVGVAIDSSSLPASTTVDIA